MSERLNDPAGVKQRIPARAMADALERMADGKTSLFGRMTLVRKVRNFAGSGWLADFSRGHSKPPDHEIAPEPALRAVNPKRSFHELQKQQELTVLQQAAHDYRGAARPERRP